MIWLTPLTSNDGNSKDVKCGNELNLSNRSIVHTIMRRQEEFGGVFAMDGSNWSRNVLKVIFIIM